MKFCEFVCRVPVFSVKLAWLRILGKKGRVCFCVFGEHMKEVGYDAKVTCRFVEITIRKK